MSSGDITDDYLHPTTCGVTPRILAHEEALAASNKSKILGKKLLLST